MNPKNQILARIIELEVDQDGEQYLGEGEQAELNTLYWVSDILNLFSEEEESKLHSDIEEAREKWREENL